MKKIITIFMVILLSNLLIAEPLRYFGQTQTSYKSKIPYGNNSETGKYVKSGNTKIYYEVYGEGKPLVILHGGIVGSIAEMSEFIDKLSKDYKVIAVSTRGHGKSEIGNEIPSYEQKAKDIKIILEKEVNEPVIIIGFSDGAYTAYHVAKNYPNKINKIVAIGAGTWEKGFRHFGGTFIEFKKLDGAYWKEQLKIRPNPEKVNEWYQSILKYYNELDLTDNFFRDIKVPVLVLAGEKDANAPLDTVIKAYKALPNAQLAIIPNGSHGVFQDNFLAVWDCVIPFIK